MTKKQLFLQLANPDNKGFSEWVSVKKFTGIYSDLKFGNGGSWCRRSSSLAREYDIETDKTTTNGNSIDYIRLAGFNSSVQFQQNVRQDIKEFYKDTVCVMTGIKGISENTKIELDHKDGRKNNERVSNIQTQTIDDFQPLIKPMNDIKRQICKACKETGKRWKATNIIGFEFSFYKGDENYTEELGCIGCYQYDPIAYRRRLSELYRK